MGGYHILDLKNISITVDGPAVAIPGVYESLEGSYRKPTLLSNLVIGDVETFDRFVVFGHEQSKFVSQISIDGNVMLLKMTITSEDEVTIEQL